MGSSCVTWARHRRRSPCATTSSASADTPRRYRARWSPARTRQALPIGHGRRTSATAWSRSPSGVSRASALFHEDLGRDVVEELLELVHDLLLALVLVLDLDRRLRDHVLRREDRGARPHGERERVGRARIDLDLAAVHLERDRGVEGVLAQLGHRYAAAGHV